MRRSGLDASAANMILRKAEQSYSDWGADRDLRFRDVVFYVVVDEYIQAHGERLGAQVPMERVVSRTIPRDL